MIIYDVNPAGYIEITVTGMVGKDDIDRVWTQLKRDIPAEGKVNFLEIVGDLEGMEFAAFWEDMKLGLPFLNRVGYAAIVADQRWISTLSKIAGPLIATEMRVFRGDQLDEARAWLAGQCA